LSAIHSCANIDLRRLLAEIGRGRQRESIGTGHV